MTNISQQDLDDIIDNSSYDMKRQRALSRLLEELRAQAHHHLVCHVRMGGVSSYLTSVTLNWVAGNVGFAVDLPIFREVIEGSRRIKIDHGTIESVQQRQPDWRRQLPMATYLAMRRHHKFPPILLVGWQGWVYDETHERWEPGAEPTEAHAMDDSLTVQPLEPTGLYADLDDTGTQFYVVDGQHRLMAILGLADLIKKGRLEQRDKEGKVKRAAAVTRDEIVAQIANTNGETFATVHHRIQRLMDETIGVEIVPAVCRNETYGNALQRLRQMFVDVNENVKPLGKSELV